MLYLMLQCTSYLTRMTPCISFLRGGLVQDTCEVSLVIRVAEPITNDRLYTIRRSPPASCNCFRLEIESLSTVSTGHNQRDVASLGLSLAGSALTAPTIRTKNGMSVRLKALPLLPGFNPACARTRLDHHRHVVPECSNGGPRRPSPPRKSSRPSSSVLLSVPDCPGKKRR